MFDLPFSYGARRRVIERRRRDLETGPEQAALPDVVDLLRRMGVSATDARWIADRAAEDDVAPCALWRRLRRLSPEGDAPLPRTTLCRDELLAAATGGPGTPAPGSAAPWPRAS